MWNGLRITNNPEKRSCWPVLKIDPSPSHPFSISFHLIHLLPTEHSPSGAMLSNTDFSRWINRCLTSLHEVTSNSPPSCARFLPFACFAMYVLTGKASASTHSGWLAYRLQHSPNRQQQCPTPVLLTFQAKGMNIWSLLTLKVALRWRSNFLCPQLPISFKGTPLLAKFWRLRRRCWIATVLCTTWRNCTRLDVLWYKSILVIASIHSAFSFKWRFVKLVRAAQPSSQSQNKPFSSKKVTTSRRNLFHVNTRTFRVPCHWRRERRSLASTLWAIKGRRFTESIRNGKISIHSLLGKYKQTEQSFLYTFFLHMVTFLVRMPRTSSKEIRDNTYCRMIFDVHFAHKRHLMQ